MQTISINSTITVQVQVRTVHLVIRYRNLPYEYYVALVPVVLYRNAGSVSTYSVLLVAGTVVNTGRLAYLDERYVVQNNIIASFIFVFQCLADIEYL